MSSNTNSTAVLMCDRASSSPVTITVLLYIVFFLFETNLYTVHGYW